MKLILLFIFWITQWAYCVPQQQAARWKHGSIDPRHTIALDQLIVRYTRTQSTYLTIERMRPNGVPAPVCFGLLYRESNNDMTKSPAQGDPLTHKSRNVPRNRIPGVNPPYTFLQSAEDSYYSMDLDHLQTRNWSEVGALFDAVENFNGGGYRARGVTSPYVWNGVKGPKEYNYYIQGKYIADGQWSSTFVDKQLGVAAILMRMKERGIELPRALQTNVPSMRIPAPPVVPVVVQPNPAPSFGQWLEGIFGGLFKH